MIKLYTKIGDPKPLTLHYPYAYKYTGSKSDQSWEENLKFRWWKMIFFFSYHVYKYINYFVNGRILIITWVDLNFFSYIILTIYYSGTYILFQISIYYLKFSTHTWSERYLLWVMTLKILIHSKNEDIGEVNQQLKFPFLMICYPVEVCK